MHCSSYTPRNNMWKNKGNECKKISVFEGKKWILLLQCVVMCAIFVRLLFLVCFIWRLGLNFAFRAFLRFVGLFVLCWLFELVAYNWIKTCSKKFCYLLLIETPFLHFRTCSIQQGKTTCYGCAMVSFSFAWVMVENQRTPRKWVKVSSVI